MRSSRSRASPGTTTPYEVRLDGERVWPPAGSALPPPRIRRAAPGDRCGWPSAPAGTPHRCRSRTPSSAASWAPTHWMRTRSSSRSRRTPSGRTACCCWATRSTRTRPRRTQQKIRARRDVSKPPGLQVKTSPSTRSSTRESWGNPLVRWLFSTVPTSMIFDDHDVHDDWNTSRIWRRRMQQHSWWQERIIGALAAYWVYQHLGNLSPAALADDEIYRRSARPTATSGRAARLRGGGRPRGRRGQGLPLELPA